MSQFLDQLKNKIAFKANELTYDPKAEEYAKQKQEKQAADAERAQREKESAEKTKQLRAKKNKEIKILVESEPGIRRIVGIYVREDEPTKIEFAWNPWPTGQQDPNWVGAQSDFDAIVKPAAPEKYTQLMKDYQKFQNDQERRKKRENFSVGRFMGTIFSTILQYLFIFLIVGAGILGSSLAVNLNLYKPWPYRVLYAIYGFFFCFLVIPYVYLYRGYWLRKVPVFYSLIPLIPYRLENEKASKLFGWLSFRPDDEMHSLEEWKMWKKEQGISD